jgi:hypothetical protein
MLTSSGRINAPGRVTSWRTSEYPVKILDTSEKSPEIIDTECVKCNGAIIPKKKLLEKKKIN